MNACRPLVRRETGEDATVAIKQHDIFVHRILAHIFLEALLQRPGLAGFCGKLADDLVGAEKADVGGALEQVAHQDVDDHLRTRLHFLFALGQRLFGEVVQQFAGQAREGFARLADFRRRAGKLAEQVEVVPDGLQRLQHFAVFLDQRHVRQQLAHVVLDFDSLVFRHTLLPIAA